MVSSPPEVGQVARVRDRHWVVSDLERSTQPLDLLAPMPEVPQTLVRLSSVEDDGFGEELAVIWELEPGARVLETATLPRPAAGHFDDPDRLDTFLDAVRWGAIASADSRALQAPFRSGITIEDYQFDPVARALGMSRVNPLIADDVGFRERIEAELAIQDLLRHRARTVQVICPTTLCQKCHEMHDRLRIEHCIAGGEAVHALQHTQSGCVKTLYRSWVQDSHERWGSRVCRPGECGDGNGQ